ncbi:GntR family transcriptional regulator [Paracoccus sp. MKU1]|uniref:GntR family transcriptional regulator n=1 Tax=Paracoccus sp. MKU1 TaxID=1745182 RepID=UPI00071928E8|nr:GntR family transcriptional regulator [Paracoccus sp. MKU1]KRW96746.1 GntR family transcriptional regulator [Paracoccus sp. MKU1]
MSGNKATQVTAEPIYDALKSAIMAGDLLPGEPLRQDEIARNHGVSKIPVREALLRLEVDGFVTFRKNKGATVRELTPHEILNLLDIRVALECKALELAIPHMVHSDFDKADRILAEYGESTDISTWSDLNVRFHQALYDPCDNPLLLQMIDDLRARIGPVTRLLVTETSGLERPHQEHRRILDACKAGEVEKAVDLMRQHIETTKKETAARLRRR